MSATDITLSTNIIMTDGGDVEEGKAGVAILAGQAVYKGTDGRYLLAIANALAASMAVGVALNSCPAANQPLKVGKRGTLTGLTGLEVGEAYFVSDTTAGALQKESDFGTGEYVTYMGIAASATSLKLHIDAGGVAHA